MNTKKTLLSSALVLYFVIAFEVLIMISPFAGFFYSVMNPVLLKLAASSSTRWLSAFYLPHMVLPQDGLLQAIRVLGSVLFVAGMAVFFVCAAQIYTAKFTKKGAVLGGLYAYIRHPQYVALGVAGLGLSILWPRFLTIVLWLAMAFVYYALAKDEERRMLNAHGATYRTYIDKTGMFLPARLEKRIAPTSMLMKAVFVIGCIAVTLGCAALLRMYTINRLTLWNNGKNVSAVAILPEDGFKMEHRMAEILALPPVKERLQAGKQYLVYFIPRDYIMQGMIADTGGDWKLYKQHHTIAMISDWVFHPFRHLREGHHAMHHEGMQMQHQNGTTPSDGLVRRLIFLSIEDVNVNNTADLFSINALRVPQFMVDVDIHNAAILDVKELNHGSGWGTVPTPTF
ncbi:MAG: isoprenylcysteine carboxylmethyltransferase family protein [Nitrospiraceae bacterium]|nr:isoprenylcysteine carboxylmethyltransferase family protein [Nitrospiraceae bacterium]